MRERPLPTVRPETADDIEAVRRVNELAFGRGEEAALVDALRASDAPRVSLVAVEGGRVVGHIFFSPVAVGEEEPPVAALGLAPMAVLPGWQRSGVGSLLVREGLKESLRAGYKVVVVLGHPEYYPRFGFVKAATRGLSCEYDVPEEAFMVLELEPGALGGRRGVVRYRPEFGAV